MKFFQKDDGSCELYFAEQEIDIIKKHKKLIFEPKFFKHFVNNLVNIAVRFQDNFDKKTKDLKTIPEEEVFTEGPKDDK